MTTTATKEKENVIHLHGNLFRVRLDSINFAEPDENANVFGFSNPRHVLGSKAKGFSKEEMNELRESIRTEGLSHPIVLRWIDVGEGSCLQVVSGERRTRSLLKLCNENASCYDPDEEVYKPAKELYEYVDCRINNMDDFCAFKHAFSENDRAIGIGDGATVALVKQFRNANWTDDQILQVTGKSITWLRDTDFLVGLDEDTFNALAADKINRSSALELSKIEDLEKRLDILSAAESICEERIKNLKLKLEEEIEAAQSDLEIAEGEIHLATQLDDEDFLEEAKSHLDQASSKVQAKVEKNKKLLDSSKITAKDLQKAKKTAGNGNAGKLTLTRAKIKKNWYQVVVGLIENNGLDEDGEDVGIDLDDAKLVKTLCEKIENGDSNIIGILSKHNSSK